MCFYKGSFMDDSFTILYRNFKYGERNVYIKIQENYKSANKLV